MHRLAVAQSNTLRIIAGARTVVLVGASANTQRASYFVLSYLTTTNLTLYAVNPRYQKIATTPCYPALGAVPEAPDIVVIFRPPQYIPAIVQEAADIGAGNVWFQLGLTSTEGAEIAARHGMGIVQDRCIKLEHSRWAGKLRWAGANTGVISSRRTKRL